MRYGGLLRQALLLKGRNFSKGHMPYTRLICGRYFEKNSSNNKSLHNNSLTDIQFKIFFKHFSVNLWNRALYTKLDIFFCHHKKSSATSCIGDPYNRTLKKMFDHRQCKTQTFDTNIIRRHQKLLE